MGSINDFGTGTSTTNDPPLDVWAAAVRDALNGSDVTVDDRIAPVAPLGDSTAWPGFSPTISQGASTDIAATKACKWLHTPALVIARYRIDFTAAGTAGSNIIITLPTPAATNGFVAGGVYYVDASATDQRGDAFLETASTFSIATTAGKLGTSPAITVASGDIVTTTVIYEPA